MYSKYYSNFHAALTILDRISRTGHYKKFIEVWMSVRISVVGWDSIMAYLQDTNLPIFRTLFYNRQQCAADNPPGTASLHLMLAFPLRRLSAYRDLISAICQATQSNHPDHTNLMRALEQTSTITNELRIEYLMAQDQLALWDIQSTMVGLPEPIMIPARRLILRADLHKVDASLALEPRTYYLMNDVLLYARFDPKKNIYTFKVSKRILEHVKNAVIFSILRPLQFSNSPEFVS